MANITVKKLIEILSDAYLELMKGGQVVNEIGIEEVE